FYHFLCVPLVTHFNYYTDVSRFFCLRNPLDPGLILFPYTTLFRSRRLERAHRQVLEDLLVDAPLDLGALVSGQRLRMREVEAQRPEEHTSELQSRFELV